MSTDGAGQPGPSLRVAVAFGSPMMRHGCAAILTTDPGVLVTCVGGFEDAAHLGSDDIDVAVVGMVVDRDAGGQLVRRLTGRGVRVLVVLPPGVSGEAAAAVGAAGWVSGASVTETDLLTALHAAVNPEAPIVGNVLSARERAVLTEVARGCTDREIGDRLGISMRTVQSHLDRIRGKTGRRRRAELTQLAFEIGVADHGSDGGS